jgi:hypothetical protein
MTLRARWVTLRARWVTLRYAHGGMLAGARWLLEEVQEVLADAFQAHPECSLLVRSPLCYAGYRLAGLGSDGGEANQTTPRPDASTQPRLKLLDQHQLQHVVVSRGSNFALDYATLLSKHGFGLAAASERRHPASHSHSPSLSTLSYSLCSRDRSHSPLRHDGRRQVTGHSLGAGIAVLLTMMVREQSAVRQLAAADCVTFACPACCTFELAMSCTRCPSLLSLS